MQLIDKATDEGETKLDLPSLELEELPPEIGKCTGLETLVLGEICYDSLSDRTILHCVNYQL
ncbi:MULTISPECIES: hypothetical protein [Microcoleaceae]|uniref:hypothetical protein n=1 Tax=Microcoleaceae TaxID=1892252 RepID=UPI0018806A42|nr:MULTISPECIES: hypothetical protein [unclassified Tychonema]MBE9119747.1 hypothetical protein [Tychonema sp. LEGE 07199]MBE9131638.1 hypothetical protein [Tychonema sp. LEGE 07196]MBE9160994.1 hypothetical protein [Tychonema sp. LEGE 06208]